MTHTIGVFALGLVTLFLSQYILPEDLYPWLNLAAGLLIVGVGLGVLRSRLRWRRERLAGQSIVASAAPDPNVHTQPRGEHDTTTPTITVTTGTLTGKSTTITTHRRRPGKG